MREKIEIPWTAKKPETLTSFPRWPSWDTFTTGKRKRTKELQQTFFQSIFPFIEAFSIFGIVVNYPTEIFVFGF